MRKNSRALTSINNKYLYLSIPRAIFICGMVYGLVLLMAWLSTRLVDCGWYCFGGLAKPYSDITVDYVLLIYSKIKQTTHEN